MRRTPDECAKLRRKPHVSASSTSGGNEVRGRKDAGCSREAEERKRLDTFKPHSAQFEVGGETVCVSWGGPIDTIANVLEPRAMTLEFFEALYRSICKHPTEPLQPIVEYVRLQNAREVWETDTGRTWRRKLRSPELPDVGSVLRVIPRSSHCSAYCPGCYRLSSGNYCPPCGSKVGRPVSIKRIS